jgi:hypothetical protein
VRKLQELPGIGVSRATKILALTDQRNLGIYDSHAAASLRPITEGGKPLIRVPPGMSKKLQGTSPVSQKQLADDYPKYNAVLRRLLENAEQDSKYGKAFRRVADVERALFGASRSDVTAPAGGGPAGASATLRGARGVPGTLIAGAAPGALRDSAALRAGNLDGRTFLIRRVKEGGLAGAASGATKIAERFGKATSGIAAHAQGGARAGGVAAIVGALAEMPAVMRNEVPLRDFVENRGLDLVEGGGGKLAGSLVVAAAAAAPFEAPVIVVGAGVIGAGILTTRTLRPARRWVGERQHWRSGRDQSSGAVDDAGE